MTTRNFAAGKVLKAKRVRAMKVDLNLAEVERVVHEHTEDVYMTEPDLNIVVSVEAGLVVEAMQR